MYKLRAPSQRGGPSGPPGPPINSAPDEYHKEGEGEVKNQEKSFITRN